MSVISQVPRFPSDDPRAQKFNQIVSQVMNSLINSGFVTQTSIGIWSLAIPFGVPSGGTGRATLTANAVLLGAGTSPVNFATIGTAGRLLIDKGAATDPAFTAMSGDATIASTGAITLANTTVTAAAYGSASAVGTFTVDSKGRLTAAATTSIVIAESQVTNLVTDLAGKQPLDATLTAFAALTIAANSLTIGTGADAFSQTTFAANTFPARASTGDLVAKTITDFGLSLVDDADASAGRATLGVVIGTDVQAWDATLDALAALTIAANSLTIGTGADAFSQTTFASNTFPARASTGDLVAKTITDFGLSLVDDADASAGRTTLGLVIGTNVQAWDATLDALAALTIAANSLTIGTGADAFSQTTFAANTFPARASTGDLVAKTITDFGLSLVDDADASAGRTTLGLVIGTNVQAWDATLDALAALTIAANSLTIGTGADAFSQTTFAANTFPARASTGDLVAKTITDFGLSLVDDADASAGRTPLGLVIGTNVQAWDATLDALAALTIAANSLTIGTGADAFSQTTFAANTFPR